MLRWPESSVVEKIIKLVRQIRCANLVLSSIAPTEKLVQLK